MEKQRIKSIAKSCRRLLVLFFLFTVESLYSQNILRASEEKNFYVNTDIKFQLLLPDTLPGQIDVSMPEEEDNVTFKTLRKVESGGGTKIEIWFSFSKTGVYKLKPLTVKVRNFRKQQLAFEEVRIGINPKEQEPLCVILSGSSRNKDLTVQAGKKIHFTVCLQYATQLVGFNWEIPKDSIFVQGKLYDFAEVKQREKVITDNLIPVCDFEWTPLVPGIMSFPVFEITAIAYNGDKINVSMPKISVRVLENKASEEKKKPSYFASAFENDQSEEAENKLSVEAGRDAALTVAELRRRERHSLSVKARRERASFEQSLGLPYNQREFALIWIYLTAFLVIAVIVFLIILIRKKRNVLSITIAAVLVCSLVLLIYTIVKGSRRYGVSVSCEVLSIPEASAGVKSELPACSRVQILSESGDWYFIRFGETEGWCSKDGIILI